MEIHLMSLFVVATLHLIEIYFVHGILYIHKLYKTFILCTCTYRTAIDNNYKARMRNGETQIYKYISQIKSLW